MAVLSEEMDSIHYANRLFWEQKAHSREASVEYYRRQDRLEEIRSELTGLIGAGESSRPPSSPPPVGGSVSLVGLCPRNAGE
jgi:hypothetical protein